MRGQPRGHLILVLNEWRVVTLEVFVLCGWWFSNQFDIVSETHLSCNTVGCELWLAILNSLLCPETGWNIRIGKQGYVFILTDFKRSCFHVSFWHHSMCQQLFWDWENLNFLHKLTSETFWFTGFVKFEVTEQWFSAYQDQFCPWFSLAVSSVLIYYWIRFFESHFRYTAFLFEQVVAQRATKVLSSWGIRDGIFISVDNFIAPQRASFGSQSILNGRVMTVRDVKLRSHLSKNINLSHDL